MNVRSVAEKNIAEIIKYFRRIPPLELSTHKLKAITFFCSGQATPKSL